MKITLKTLKGQQLPLDVEPDCKVGDLKNKIESEHGIAAGTQKLIAYGKVMEDENKTITDYKIAENGFIVVMTVKAKPVRAAAEDAKQEEGVPQPGVTLPAQANQPVQVVSSIPNPVQPTQPPVAQPVRAGGLPPGVDEEAISTIVAITGKPRDWCIQALQLTQGNADMACSLLFEGIGPEQMQQMLAGASGGGAGVGGGMGEIDDYDQEYGAEDPGMAGGMGDNNAMAELMNNPQMPMIAERLRSNPQFYQEFMTRLQTQNPLMFAQIQANPMAFMNLVMGGNPNIGMGAGAMGGGPGTQAQQPRRPPAGQIQVTQQELEAIKRLQALGFSQHRALEAYLSCDKNEEYAANFLFESMIEDDSAQMEATIANSLASATQPQPESVPQQQPEPVAPQQPAAGQQQPADNVDMNNDGGPDNNNDNNGNGDAGAGGEGAEKSAFQ